MTGKFIGLEVVSRQEEKFITHIPVSRSVYASLRVASYPLDRVRKIERITNRATIATI